MTPRVDFRKTGDYKARTTGFTKETVNSFFDVLAKIVADNKLHVGGVFNANETVLFPYGPNTKLWVQREVGLL